MKNMKKVLATLLVLCLAIGLFAGCAKGTADATASPAPSAAATTDGSAAPAEKSGDIKVLHKWSSEDYAPWFEKVFKAYTDANPKVKITIEATDDEGVKDKLRVLMGSNDQPDIYFSWCGEFANKFIRTGNAWDMTAAFENDKEFKDSLMEASLEPYVYEGKNYGISLRINAKFFMYNKEIFDKVGVTVPKTWAEFMTVCEKIKAAGITPIAFGNQSPWAGCHYITGLNNKLVPEDIRKKDYVAATGEYTDPGYVQALQLLADMNTKGYFNNGSNAITHTMATEDFAMGNSAIVYVELEEFASINDKLEGKAWDFFAMPDIEGQKGQNYLTGAPDGFMISPKSKNPEVAFDVIKSLLTIENAKDMISVTKWPSPVKGAHTSENTADYLLRGIDAITAAPGMALWLDTDINIKISDVYLPGIQEIFDGTQTPEGLMTKVQEMAKTVAAEEAAAA